jgi:PAS domain S-box-containing protein
LLDSVRDHAIFMLDPEGLVTTWNAGAERIKGYTPEEIIGQHVSVFYPPDDIAAGKPAQDLATAVRTGRSDDEGWRIRKDGSRFWASCSLSPIHDAAGRLVGFSKITRDLTERRVAHDRLIQSEQRFRLLVDSVRDYAIFLLDSEGNVQTWNLGAQAIKGYDASEIIGRHIETFYTPEDRIAGKPRRLLGIAAAEGRVEDEGWRQRKDGTRFWADAVITALHDSRGGINGFAKVTRDLTERREAEEHRLGLVRATEAVRLRDEFLSIASHELKTPLTAMQMQLETLRGRIDDPKSAAKIERAFRSGERLANLIESLLDVSRIATGRLTLRPVPSDLGEIVRHTVEALRETAAAGGAELTYAQQGPTSAPCDPLRIEQVVMNLVSNAIKYGPGRPIEVAVHGGDAEVEISVRDEGPGIAEEDRARIFGRFERAASNDHHGGLGLGLYVAREIVAAHGGSVSVESSVPGGSRFVVRLPRQGVMTRDT